MATRLAGLIAASCALAFPAAALADTTVDFEQFPPGTVVTNQYADLDGPGQGVVFGPLPAGAPGDGLRPVIRMPPAGQAQSGSQVADIATCVGCEFFTPRTTGTFGVPRAQVSVYVGYLGEPAICTQVNPDSVGCAFVRLRAFDASGNQVAESFVRVTRGAGIRSLLSVSTSSPTIVGFEISGRPMIDDSKPIAIDDLSFGTPPPAPTPDFTLNPATTSLILEQGGTATDAITIGRLGGSNGNVSFGASGLPAGVSATFAPNPAPGSQTVLTLRADANALTGSGTVTVTGTPESASVGPAPRSFSLGVVVQPACPQVDTAQELVNALAAGFKCIFVTGEIDLASIPDPPDPGNPVIGPGSILGDLDSILVIPDGVTLMGGRSPTQSGGMLAVSHRVAKPIMLKIGPNTRITGLRLRGYDYNRFDTGARKDPTKGIYVRGPDVMIDNNEIFGWPSAGVELADAPMIRNTVDKDRVARITGNFIHNNVQCNLGYGIVMDAPVDLPDGGKIGPGFARIDHNVFVFNRHHIASSGGPGPGYIATLNFALHRGPTCGGNYNQHFDMHGEDGEGGTAGTYIEIRRNTFHGAQSYGFNGRLTRPAFELRGTPVEKAIFAENVVAHRYALKQRSAGVGPVGGTITSKGAVRVKGASTISLLIKKKLVIKDNRTCVDTASELAVGDFNGDGRDDVFQAVGTLWVYSPSGRREWFVLNDSNLRLDRLGLGDFNDDGKSDVFFRNDDRWLVSYGGTSEPTPLPAGSKIDIKNYRFGDFDGDRRTDVFRANGSRFFYSSAGTTSWQPLAASRLGLGELRFGDFDGDGKTDVFSLANDQWSVSYGGTTSWKRLNRKLASKLGSLAFADFNGDGKTDVARNGNGKWEVSLGGATPWRTLAFGRSEPLNLGMLFGDFDGDGRDDVLQHGAKSASGACSTRGTGLRSFDRFKLSTGGARSLERWSSADMR